MAIVVLVLWLATATAGLTLLRAGGSARQAAAPQAEPADSLAGALVRTGAVPLTAEGKPPPGPHVRVDTPAGEHPLLEFSHPALGVAGIACWMMFTFVHYRPLAWIAFAILVVTLIVGLGWLSRTQRSGARQGSQAWTFPSRLIWVHGLIAACSIVLTVLTAVIASRG